MQIVERENIDIEKWDKLVSLSVDSSVFSLSWYLDAVAENWCIVVDDMYSKGMALPYTKRLGVEILYTPIFVRYMEWFGSKSEWPVINDLIRNRFHEIQLCLKEKVLGEDVKEYVYQSIREEREIKNQAKRSLNKATKNGLKVEVNTHYEEVYDVIQSELESKIQGLDKQSIDRLEILLRNAQKKNVLKTYHVVADGTKGGILCIQNDKRLLYLKGAVDQGTKKIGGMYLAMDYAINYALESGLLFDFGGSRVEGVRNFNHNLGGEDAVYYAYVVNNGPIWFKYIRTLKNKWSKK